MATPEDRDLLQRTAASRLTGGRNNAVRAAELDGRRVCLKLYRTDDRAREAARLWRRWSTGPDPGRLLAFFWLALSLREDRYPSPTVEPSAQLQRVRTLLTRD